MKEEFNLMDRQVENSDDNKDTDDEVITEQGVLGSSCVDNKDNFIHKLQPHLRNAENAAINTLQMKMSPIHIHDINNLKHQNYISEININQSLDVRRSYDKRVESHLFDHQSSDEKKPISLPPSK